jgi:lipid-binding SYLF domain-containing protein
VDNALANLYRQDASSQQLVNRARGVLVFPSVLEAGFVVGAWRGDGALRKGGKTVSYHRTTGGSFGLQAGAQSTAVFLLFMSDDALARFEASRGWTAGVDASVTVLTVGANAQMTSATSQQPIIGFVLSNQGLMAGVTVDGSRITRLDL